MRPLWNQYGLPGKIMATLTAVALIVLAVGIAWLFVRWNIGIKGDL